MEYRLELRAVLERTRRGTEDVLAPLSDRELEVPVASFPAPLAWLLARIAYFEELWLLRNLLARPALDRPYAELYAALEHEPGEPSALPPLRSAVARAYADDVRGRVLEGLEDVDFDAPNALLRGGFVFGLVVQHELQHQEAILQALQGRADGGYPIAAEPVPDRAPGGPAEIRVPAGSFVIGAVDDPWAYDNELPSQEIELDGFAIDRAPVTNGAFAEFLADSGYSYERIWDPAGWEWREREAVTAPAYWQQGDGGWMRLRFGRSEPLPADEPVQHVSWYEADAFARWAGKRLPTEAEWERAAGWHPRAGKFRFPWGQEWVGYEANLGRRRFSPAPAGSYAGGVSPVGCVQMGGDVWEWTSSSFGSYPGFLAFPYPECSELYFGDEYRVLRGGSWATDPLVARTTFRSWEHPTARHAFAGLRCARDA